MTEHSRKLGHPLYPLAGSQLRAEVAPSSCNNVAVDSIISSTINSTIGMAMHTNISDQDQNEKSSVYSNIRQSSGSSNSSSSGSSSCRNSKEGCNRTVVLVAHPSIDHHIVHDTDGGGGGGGGDGGGGGNRSDHTSLNFPTPSSKTGTVDLHDNNEVEPVGRSPSSPVASDPEKGVLVLGNPLQNLGGDEDASTHSDQYGDTLPSVPFPLSSSGGSEDDELSSVDYDVDEDGEEGGGEEAKGELDAAVDRVFVLFEQGQEALEKNLVERAEQGRNIIRDPERVLEKNREEQDVATGRLKLVMGYLVDRLSTAEQERRLFKENKSRLRVKLEVEEKRHAETREFFTTRVAELVEKLEKAEMSQAQLTVQRASLIAANERLEETKCGLQAEVARLASKVDDFTVDTSALAGSHIIEATIGATDLGSSTPTPSGDFVGPVVISAGELSSLSAAAAAKGRESSPLSAGTPSRPKLEVACMNAPFAVILPVDKVMASSPAVSDVVEAATGAANVDIPAATVSGGVVGPAASPADGLSPLPTDTGPKGMAASSLQRVTPPHPRVEVACANPPFSAPFCVGKTASSPPAVTTPPRSMQQASSKTDKPTGGAERLSKCREFNSSLVEELPNKVYEAPRRYTRRPLTSVNLNSNRKHAAGRDNPLFAVRAATTPYTKRSSVGGEVASLASRGVSKPALQPYLKRSSIGREVPPFSSERESKPASKAHPRRSSTGGEMPPLSLGLKPKPAPKAHPKRSSTGREVLPLSSRLEAKPTAKAHPKHSSTGRGLPLLSSLVETKPAPETHPKRSSTGREIRPLSSRVEAKLALRTYLKPGSTGKKGPALAARVATGSADKSESGGKGAAVEVGSGCGAHTGRVVKGKGSGDGWKVEVAASDRVLRSSSRTAAAAAATKKEVAISAPSGTMPADSFLTIQPARATRSATRRLAQQANTTRRDVSSRGKFMSF